MSDYKYSFSCEIDNFGFWRELSSLSRCATAALVTGIYLFLCATTVHAEIKFEDVTVGSGTEYEGESYGASWGDSNSDGWPDLFVNHHRNTPSAYLNQADGSFEDRGFEVDIWRERPNRDMHGGSWADFDNDGDQDLFITIGSSANSQFLVNTDTILSDEVNDSTFTFDVVNWAGRMPTWLDFDLDGLLDFAVSLRSSRPQMHRQIPGARDFQRVNSAANAACVINDGSNYSLLSDVNNDSRLDFVCLSAAFAPDEIYNVGQLPFTTVANQFPVISNVTDTAIGDFNGDLVNDFVMSRGRLRQRGAAIVSPSRIEAHLIPTEPDIPQGIDFKTTGDVTFQVTWASRNINRVFIGSQGINTGVQNIDTVLTFTLSASNPDHQGIVDIDPTLPSAIYIGYDVASETWQYRVDRGNTFAYTYTFIDSTVPDMSDIQVFGLNNSDAPNRSALVLSDPNTGDFIESAQASGLGQPQSCASVVAADFDNDMDVDIYMACRTGIENIPNIVYENQGDGTFVLLPPTTGGEGPLGFNVGLAESVTVADYDVDGRVDLFVTNGLKLYPEFEPLANGGPDVLLRNTSDNNNNWIQLDLVGTRSNRDSIGAKVFATAGGVTQLREQNGGFHRWSQDHQRIHFGLAQNTSVDIQVIWPNGDIDNFTIDGITDTVNNLYRITESDGVSGPSTIEQVTLTTSVPLSPCVEPEIDRLVEQGLFVWRDCNADTWHVRVTGGGVSTNYEGSVLADDPLASLTAFNIETNDSVDSPDSRQIIFDLVSGATGIDGFDFSLQPGTSACLSLDAPAGADVFLGFLKNPITLPIDLLTLGPCNNQMQLPSVSVEDAVVNEADGIVSVPLNLSFAATDVVTVELSTTDGSATSPDDYAGIDAALPQIVTFQPGDLSASVDITINDDLEAEGTEDFNVTISNLVGSALISRNSAVITLEDDEINPIGRPVVDRDVDQALFLWQDETTGAWNVEATAGGSTQTLNFVGEILSDQGFTQVTPVSIEGNDVLDNVTDPNAILFDLAVRQGAGPVDEFNFSFPIGASVCFTVTGAPSGQTVLLGASRQPLTAPFDLATLQPCTGVPTRISVADVSVSETEASVDIPVTLLFPSTEVVTVELSTTDGTAVSPDDYTGLTSPATVIFPVGQTSVSVTIPIIDDNLAEGPEAFNVELSNPSTNALIEDGTAVVSIEDNEASPLGRPAIDRDVDQELFLYQDATTGAWTMVATAGGAQDRVFFSGSITSDLGFTQVTDVSIEQGAGDVLDFVTDPNEIVYSMGVRDGAGPLDEFNFLLPAGASTCVLVSDAPSGQRILVGESRTPFNAPFNLATLGPCTGITSTVSLVGDVTVAEDAGVATVELSLSPASNEEVTVELSTLDGSAVSPADYTGIDPLAPTVVTFAIGQTTASVDIAIVDDTEVESTESFSVNIANVTGNAQLGTAAATVNITDNDVAISPFGRPNIDRDVDRELFAWQDQGTGRWNVVASAGGVTQQTFFSGVILSSQGFSSVQGIGIEGSDTLDFTTNPNEIAFSLRVATGGGPLDEFNFDVPAGASVCFMVSDIPSGQTVLIGESRVPVTAPFDLATLGPCTGLPSTVTLGGDITVSEGAGTVSVPLNLTLESTEIITVEVTTLDDTAVSPDDYTGITSPQTITFQPGEITTSIDIPIQEDLLLEGDERFTVNLSNVSPNSVIGTGTITVTIVDNEDNPFGRPDIDRDVDRGLFAWQDQATGRWNVVASAGGVTDLSFFTGTIVSDQDFIDVNGISIEGTDTLDATTNPSEIAYSLRVATGGGPLDEFNFSFPAGASVCFMVSDAPSGQTVLLGESRIPVTAPFDLATLGPCTAAVSTVSLGGDITVAEGAGSVSIPLNLSLANTDVLTVEVATTNGSAVSPDDYAGLATPQTVTFQPGDTSMNVSIPIVDDALTEGLETFSVSLSNASANAAIGTGLITVSIADNEVSALGEPNIDRDVDQALFVWQDEVTGDWNVVATGGGFTDRMFTNGMILSDIGFNQVTPLSIEEIFGDFVDNSTDPNRIAYRMGVASGLGPFDAFSFSLPAGAATCFLVSDAPSGQTVLVGESRTPVTAPFDLATFGPCTGLPTTVTLSGNISVDETDSIVSVPLNLTQTSTDIVTVDVATIDGLAISASDYTGLAAPQTVTFQPGETRQVVDLSIIDDSLFEGLEDFTVSLSNVSSNAVIAASSTTVFITDDEAMPFGRPSIDRNVDRELFIWQDENTGRWNVVASAGGVSTPPTFFTGSIVSDQDFIDVNDVSIENSDTFDFTTDPSVIDFSMRVATGGGPLDEFNFSFPVGASVCFSVTDSPAGTTVLLGENRIPVTVPINLATLGACQ